MSNVELITIGVISLCLHKARRKGITKAFIYVVYNVISDPMETILYTMYLSYLSNNYIEKMSGIEI